MTILPVKVPAHLNDPSLYPSLPIIDGVSLNGSNMGRCIIPQIVIRVHFNWETAVSANNRIKDFPKIRVPVI